MRLLIHAIAAVLFDVRIDDRHHLAALGRQRVLHRRGIGEERLVPGKVALTAAAGDQSREKTESAIQHE